MALATKGSRSLRLGEAFFELGAAGGRRAPGPGGPWLGGALPMLKENPLPFFASCADRFGDVVRLEFGPRPAHIVFHLVRDPADIRRVLQDNRSNYRKSFSYGLLRAALGNGLLTSEGDFWLRQRRLIQPAFSRDHVRLFAEAMVDSTEAAVGRWLQQAGRAPLDVAAEMGALTLDIVGRALFGTDLRDTAGEIGPALTMLLQQAARVARSPLMLLGPYNRFVPLPSTRRIVRGLKTLDQVVRRLIAERRAHPGGGDLLDMLLAAREDDGSGMSDQQVRDEVMTFLLAGHETTANALAWTWYLLDGAPEVLARLRSEVDVVVGAGRPDAATIERLPYATAVIHEAMRLYPPAWIIERQALGEDELGGYRIAAGSVVAVSPYLAHRNPASWPEPDRFDPERFLGAPPSRYAYLPFGAGHRACIGSGFAIQEAVLALAVMVGRLEFRLAPGARVDTEPTITLRPRGGLPMTVREVAAA